MIIRLLVRLFHIQGIILCLFSHTSFAVFKNPEHHEPLCSIQNLEEKVKHEKFLKSVWEKIVTIGKYRSLNSVKLRSKTRSLFVTDYFLNYYQEHCDSNTIPSTTEGALNQLFLRSTENRLRILESNIRINSYFRDVSQEIEEIKEYTELGFKIDLSDQMIEHYRTQGFENSKNRKPSCSFVSLNSSVLSSVKNQQGLSWCYAYTAADMISYRLNQRVSAIDIARSYSAEYTTPSSWGEILSFYNPFGNLKTQVKENLDLKTGGHSFKAMQAAIKRGVCLEDELPSSEGKTFESQISSIEVLRNQFKRTKLKSKKDEIKKLLSSLLHEHFTADELTHLLERPTQRSIIKYLVYLKCKNRISLKQLNPLFNTKVLEYSDNADPLLFKLDEQMDKGNISSIGLNSQVLIDPEMINTRKENLHVVTIVGRQFNSKTNGCEYQIRNSWGNDCSRYPYLKCNKGNVWLPEEALRKAINHVHFFSEDT